ncbi:MAG: thiamine phosphate synthase [Pyrinomonadaceae bacterium]
MIILPNIYPILSNEKSKEAYVEKAILLLNAGARIIQIREKNKTSNEFFEIAIAVQIETKRYGARLIINDRADITLAVNADGVHLGQTDLNANFARKLLGSGKIIGVSTHSLEQAVAACTLPIDYLAFGPVFTTTTKENADPVVGLRNLRAVQKLKGKLPLVAIGGITTKTAAETIKNGADSLAVIGALASNENSVGENYRNLLSSINVAV